MGRQTMFRYALEDKRFIVIPDELRSYNRFINYTLLDMVPIQSANPDERGIIPKNSAKWNRSTS